MEKIRKQISSKDEKENEEYNEKVNERSEISRKIGNIKEELSESFIAIKEKKVEPKIAIKIYDEWIKTLDNLIIFCRTRSEEQKQEAARKFNNNINELLNNLKFREFRSVQLNKDSRLYIERWDEKASKYIHQQVKTLSTSEKLTMALILQLALKETYIPEIPFFILDDVFSDFDDDRKEKILKYLSIKAKDSDWFVVIANLIEKEGSAKIRVWEN